MIETVTGFLPVDSVVSSLDNGCSARAERARSKPAESFARKFLLNATPPHFKGTVCPRGHSDKLVFNHQPHHRVQLTTLLSQQGCDPGVTDLFAMLRDEAARASSAQ